MSESENIFQKTNTSKIFRFAEKILHNIIDYIALLTRLLFMISSAKCIIFITSYVIRITYVKVKVDPIEAGIFGAPHGSSCA